MPLYDFQCAKCGEVFEVMLRFSEADKIPACPKCESKNTKKKLSKIYPLQPQLPVPMDPRATVVVGPREDLPDQDNH